MVATLRGDVDLGATPRIRERLHAEVETNVDGVIVDLTGVGFLDSAGLDLLFALSRRLRERGRHMAIVIPEGAFLDRLLVLSEIGRVAVVHRSVEGALDSLTDRR